MRLTGVTGQQRMLTPPQHLILPSQLSEVRGALHSILLVGWLVVYCFTSRSRVFHYKYGYVTITDEGLQNLGLCSALRAFEQGGIFSVPHLLRHGASVFPVSFEGPPHSVAFYDTQGDVENLFLPRFSRVPYQSPLTTHKGMWRIYSNPDPHGVTRIDFWITIAFYTLLTSLFCICKAVEK
jgi:hypothetical protein